MTKAGLTDFLSAGALTSQEKSPRARSVGQNKLNTEETPPLLHNNGPQAARRLGGSGLVSLF